MDEKVDGISIVHKKKVQKGASLANTGLLHGDKWSVRHLLFADSSEGVSANVFCWLAAVSITKEDYPIVWISSPGSKFFIVAVPLAVSAAIFLCPLYIQTQCPCLTKQLPKKPDLIGHRGAPMVSRTTFSPTTRGHTCRRHAGHRFVTTSPPLPLNQEEVIYSINT